MNLKDALQLRAKRKRRFHRQDGHKKVEVGMSYRRPRGLHSKMRLGLKSYARRISSGFRSPVLARGLHGQGLAPIVVFTLRQLDAIEPKTQGAVLGASLGDKRREQLLVRALERKVTVLNFDAKAGSERIAKAFSERAKASKPVAKAAPKAAPAASVPKHETPEEHEEHEKEDKQKVLTKKV